MHNESLESRSRKFHQDMNTVVRNGLGKEREVSSMVVANKDDPKREKHRIAKDKYDPTKHVRV